MINYRKENGREHVILLNIISNSFLRIVSEHQKTIIKEI